MHSSISTVPKAPSVTRFMFVLVGTAACLVLACQTRPLVLRPIDRPLDFAPAEPFGPLHMQSFADEVVETLEGRGGLERAYRDRPVDVFNDALLSTLRQSQAFRPVDRNQPVTGDGYVLEGRLLALGTREDAMKFALAASTMEIEGRCTSEFRLTDARTGEVLLEETVTTAGTGSAQFHGQGDKGTYESEVGYEESLSQAISNNVTTIAENVMRELMRRQRAESESTAAVGAGPTAD